METLMPYVGPILTGVYLVGAVLTVIVCLICFISSVSKNGLSEGTRQVFGLEWGGDFGLSIFSLPFALLIYGIFWPMLLVDITTLKKYNGMY